MTMFTQSNIQKYHPRFEKLLKPVFENWSAFFKNWKLIQFPAYFLLEKSTFKIRTGTVKRSFFPESNSQKKWRETTVTLSWDSNY